jgi:hypothetical protein
VAIPRRSTPRAGVQTASLRGGKHTVALRPTELGSIVPHVTAAEGPVDPTGPTVEMLSLGGADGDGSGDKARTSSGAARHARGIRRSRELLRVEDIKHGGR